MEDTLTPLQRFDSFLKSTVQDQYGYTLQRVYEKAEVLGYDKKCVDGKIQELRVWLQKKENDKKIQGRRQWGWTILKNLPPRQFQTQSRRPAPSNFK